MTEELESNVTEGAPSDAEATSDASQATKDEVKASTETTVESDASAVSQVEPMGEPVIDDRSPIVREREGGQKTESP